MKHRLAASRPVVALLVLGSVGCGTETIREVEIREVPVTTTIIKEVPVTPTDPVTPQLDCTKPVYSAQPTVVAHTSATGKAVITVDGKQFKDLSGNGTLDAYEDWRLPELCRARDLVAKMTVAQKVGLMSEGSSIGGGTVDGTIPADVKTRIESGHVRQALIRFSDKTAAQLANYLNNIQELSEKQPLGIPFVVTADPVHGFGLSTNATTGAQSINPSAIVTPWPHPMGLGAANDPALSKQYGDTVRREFMAMGFRWQLGPLVDLATEPRWARVQTTFGENALHVAKHSRAVVEGMQGSATGYIREGIAATVKHFPGAGPNQDGMDSHTFPGRFNVYPGGNFAYHLIPFQSVFDVGAAAMMANYSIPKEQYQWDPYQVPAGFSYELITELAKDTMGFTGMVTGDWGTAGGSAWNNEVLTTAERAALWLKAGSHQFGSDPSSYFMTAYEQGLVAEADINGAAEKILEMSFKLGIFENPYTDADAAATVVRSEASMLAGFDAQKRAIVLVQNGVEFRSSRFAPPTIVKSKPLPITGSRAEADANGDGKVSVYFDGVVDSVVNDGATSPDQLDGILGGYDYTSPGDSTVTPAVRSIVQATGLADADIAILRISARKGEYFGLDKGIPLSFDAPFPGTQNDTNGAAAITDRNRVIDALRVRDGFTKADGTVVPAANPSLKIVLVMHMDRPGIVKPFIHGLTTLDEAPGVPGSYPLVSNDANIQASPTSGKGVDAFLVEFGAFDRAVLDFVFNKNVPAGAAGHGLARLPIEIPSSDAEVEAQYEDLPQDTVNPTFRIGTGVNL